MGYLLAFYPQSYPQVLWIIGMPKWNRGSPDQEAVVGIPELPGPYTPLNSLRVTQFIATGLQRTIAIGIDQVVGISPGRSDLDHVTPPTDSILLNTSTTPLADRDLRFKRLLIHQIRKRHLLSKKGAAGKKQEPEDIARRPYYIAGGHHIRDRGGSPAPAWTAQIHAVRSVGR